MSIKFDLIKEGEIVISLTEHSIKEIKFFDEKDMMKHRLKDIVRDITLIGKINIATINESPIEIGSEDENDEIILREIDCVRKLSNYSILPEYEECYMDANISIKDALGTIVKEESCTDLFVFYYKETFDYKKGEGEFKIVMRERI
jgi:hypothetical protein